VHAFLRSYVEGAGYVIRALSDARYSLASAGSRYGHSLLNATQRACPALLIRAGVQFVYASS
jgi:hypothetical protein